MLKFTYVIQIWIIFQVTEWSQKRGTKKATEKKGPSYTLHQLHNLKPVLFSVTVGDAVFVLWRHRVPAHTQH